MEEVKRRRGRPRKIKLPEEVQNIIDSVKKAEIKEEENLVKDIEKDIKRIS